MLNAEQKRSLAEAARRRRRDDPDKQRAIQAAYRDRHRAQVNARELSRYHATKHTAAVQARRRINLGIQLGKVEKPSACQECGAETPRRRLQAHHEDHSRPLDIQWLCTMCHGAKRRLYQDEDR